MTLKRLILIVLTIVSLIPVILSLGGSLSQPQVQARLQLYQTNLVLQASEFKPQLEGQSELSVRNALIGEDPDETAQKQYEEARTLALKGRSTLQEQLQQLLAGETDTATELEPQIVPVVEASNTEQQLNQAINEAQKFIDELNLKIGVLQAERQNIDEAFATWNEVISRPEKNDNAQTAMALVGIWSKPPLILNDAQSRIEQLDGWFRYRAQEQLYQVQEQQEALATLENQEQAIAQQAALKLVIIGAIPFLGGVIGVGLLVFLLVQSLIQKERSLLATNSNVVWETPWNWETVWQVLIVGFFLSAKLSCPFYLAC